MNQYKTLIITLISFLFFINADCDNGFRKTQRERCVNGVQGFKQVPGKKEQRDRWCISAIAESQIQATQKDNTLLLLCLTAEIELKKCDRKSAIWGISK